MMETLEQTLATYDVWLDRQPLTVKTRIAYRFQIHQYGTYLTRRPLTEDDSLRIPFVRDYLIQDYKTYPRTGHQAKPISVNLALAAIDHFHQFIGNDHTQIQHENLPAQAHREVKPDEPKAFFASSERTANARDQVIAHLIFYTTIRLGKCAALNIDDARVSTRKGGVIIRSGKGNTYREVPFRGTRGTSVLAQRTSQAIRANPRPCGFSAPKKETTLCSRSWPHIICCIGVDAHLELSAHILRHTCLTNRVRRDNDLVLVAESTRHKLLETTRRYSLPSLEDREKALEGVEIEY